MKEKQYDLFNKDQMKRKYQEYQKQKMVWICFLEEHFGVTLFVKLVSEGIK